MNNKTDKSVSPENTPLEIPFLEQVGRTVGQFFIDAYSPQDAISNALHWKYGLSFSDGNMIVGKDESQIAIAWNDTLHNSHNLTLLERTDAISVMTLLACALGFEVNKK